MKYYDIEQLPAIMRPDELADALQIGRNSVYELLHSGKIKSFRIGHQIRISKAALLHFVEVANN